MKFAILIILAVYLMPCYAQQVVDNKCNIEIPDVAMLSLRSATTMNINLAPEAPSEAGLPLLFSPPGNSDIWINYSSILPGDGVPSRSIKVKIDGEIPEGIALKLSASADAGQGGGQTGEPTGEITLSNVLQTIISGIGSCYTGAGTNNGHLLTYSLALDKSRAYKLTNNDYPVRVIFTMADNN